MSGPDDLTPVQTPSAALRLGLEDCGLCGRTGKLATGDTCWYCDGARLVTKDRAEAWRKAHPKPAVAPDYETLPDTLPQDPESKP